MLLAGMGIMVHLFSYKRFVTHSEYIDRYGGVPLFRTATIPEVLKSNEYANYLADSFLHIRRENDRVTAVKAQFPDELGLFYFGDIDDIFSFTKGTGNYRAQMDVAKFVLQHGIYRRDFQCNEPASCIGGLRVATARNEKAVRATSIVHYQVIEAMMNLAALGEFYSLGNDAADVLVALEKTDYDFWYQPVSIQRRHSNNMLFLAFLDVRRDALTRIYLQDLQLLISAPVDRRLAYREMNTDTVRVYRQAIELYYAGCFIGTVDRLRKFRSLTSHKLLNEMAILLSIRALTRPFINTAHLEQKGGEWYVAQGRFARRFPPTQCGETERVSDWIVLVEAFLSGNKKAVERNAFLDDIEYMEGAFKDFVSLNFEM